jgi:hypothetical protein
MLGLLEVIALANSSSRWGVGYWVLVGVLVVFGFLGMLASQESPIRPMSTATRHSSQG